MTEYETKKLELLERIAVAVEGGGRKAPPAKAAPPKPAPAPSGRKPEPLPLPTHLPNYGRNAGGSIATADVNDLDFYMQRARRDLADPAKSRWHAREQALVEAIDAELHHRHLEAQNDQA